MGWYTDYIEEKMIQESKIKVLGKKCNCCGADQSIVPESARPMLSIDEDKVEGLFWECSCGSTMFTKVSRAA